MARESSPTLTQVAAAAGVSLSTASRVLGGSRDRVSDTLRDRVRDAADQLGYVPNAHARALAGSRTSTVGLVVHDVSDPYFSEIARGVLRVATDHGLLVMICNSHRDPQRELAYIAALRAQRVAAIVLAGSGYEDADLEGQIDESLRAFEDNGGRAALVGRHHLRADAVLPENTEGAQALAQAVIGMGHERIGVIAGPPHLTTVRDRLDGVRRALAEAGRLLPDDMVVAGDFTRSGGHAATLRLLERAPSITALLALNDQMALGALSALRDRGIAVPEEMSVAGFDDIEVTRDVTPRLTTVHLPMEEMGTQAMRMVLTPPVRRPRRRRVASRVVLRDSTAAPAASRDA